MGDNGAIKVTGGGGGVPPTHTGDVIGDTNLTIVPDAVTYDKMQDTVANNVFLGNDDGAGSTVQELTADEARTILGVVESIDVDTVMYVDGTLGDDANDGLSAGAGGAKKTFNFLHPDATDAIPRQLNANLTIHATGQIRSESTAHHTYIKDFIGSGTLTIIGGTSTAETLTVDVFDDDLSNVQGGIVLQDTTKSWSANTYQKMFVEVTSAGWTGYPLPIMKNTATELFIPPFGVSISTPASATITSLDAVLVAEVQDNVGVAVNYGLKFFRIENCSCVIDIQNLDITDELAGTVSYYNHQVVALENSNTITVLNCACRSFFSEHCDYLLVQQCGSFPRHEYDSNGFQDTNFEFTLSGVNSVAAGTHSYANIYTQRAQGLVWYSYLENASQYSFQCLNSEIGILNLYIAESPLGIRCHSGGLDFVGGNTKFYNCTTCIESTVQSMVSSTNFVSSGATTEIKTGADTSATFTQANAKEAISNAKIGLAFSYDSSDWSNEYDNTESGLTSDNYQDAIDEIVSESINSDTTMYVDGTGGDDTNDGLTPATAKQTLSFLYSEAADAIPRELKGDLTINISNTVYSSGPDYHTIINGFYGNGDIKFVGELTDVITSQTPTGWDNTGSSMTCSTYIDVASAGWTVDAYQGMFISFNSDPDNLYPIMSNTSERLETVALPPTISGASTFKIVSVPELKNAQLYDMSTLLDYSAQSHRMVDIDNNGSTKFLFKQIKITADEPWYVMHVKASSVLGEYPQINFLPDISTGARFLFCTIGNIATHSNIDIGRSLALGGIYMLDGAHDNYFQQSIAYGSDALLNIGENKNLWLNEHRISNTTYGVVGSEGCSIQDFRHSYWENNTICYSGDGFSLLWTNQLSVSQPNEPMRFNGNTTIMSLIGSKLKLTVGSTLLFNYLASGNTTEILLCRDPVATNTLADLLTKTARGHLGTGALIEYFDDNWEPDTPGDTIYDTYVDAAGVTLGGTTLAADGTDTHIDISITPKGNAGIAIPNLSSAPADTTNKFYSLNGIAYLDGVSLETEDLNDLSDITISGEDDNDILQYDSYSAQWYNVEPNINSFYVEGINSPTDRALDTVFGMAGTPGHLSGAVVTSNVDGTIDITEGEFLVHSTNDIDSPLHVIKCPAATSLALTDNAPNTIYVSPTGPAYAVTPPVVGFFEQHWDYAPFALATRVGTTVYLLDARDNSKSYGFRRSLRESSTGSMTYGGGMAIADEGSLEFSVTAGIAYISNLTLYTTDSFDTSGTDSFTAVYSDGAGGWTRITGETSLDPDYYDDGTGTLAGITGGNYSVHWIYIIGDSPDDHLYSLYGTGDYTLTQAQEAGIPSSTPPELSVYGSAILIAKIIIEENTTVFEEIQNPNETEFTSSAVNVHNELSGLQGGQAAQYYHLTSTEYTALHSAVTLAASATTGGLSLSTQEIGFQAASTSTNGYLTSTDWNTFNNKVSNVSTSLSTGTRTATTYGITSDGGADDVVLLEATTSLAGLLGADKWDEIVANTAKVTNATHTGDVTGSGALTLASVAVTGQATVTAVDTDYILISDTDDSGNLKKALISDLTAGAGATEIDDLTDGSTTGTGNTYLGNAAGPNGSYNTGVGDNALSVVTGQRNVGFGYFAGSVLGTVYDNVAIGYGALTGSSAGNSNVAIGSNAAGISASNLGSSGVYIGYQAGNNSTAVGSELWIANSNTTSPLVYGVFPNTSITFNATDTIMTGALTVPVYTPGTTTNKLYNIGGSLYFNGSILAGGGGGATNIDGLTDGDTTSGTSVLYLGTNVGVSGSYNTGIGQACMDSLTGSFNTAVGYGSLYGTIGGSGNTAMGNQAGASITTSDYTIAIGDNALTGSGDFTGDECIGIGTEVMSGSGTKSGNYNVGIGYQTLYGITSGTHNLAVGYRSQYAVTEGTHNVSMGADSLRLLTSGISNIGIGYNAGYYVTEGQDNIVIGHSAVYGGSTTSFFDANIAIGLSSMSGAGAKSGDNNIAIGSESLYNAANTVNNVALGEKAAYSVNGGGNNIVIGKEALWTDTGTSTGSYNIALGYRSMSITSKTMTCSNNIGIGSHSLESVDTGGYNVAIGYDVAGGIEDGTYNLCFGYGSGSFIVSTDHNITMGYRALGGFSGSFTGTECIAIGHSAMGGSGAKSGNYSIAVGYQSLSSLTSGASNIGMGYHSGYGITSGDYNVSLGYESGGSVSTTDYNVALGFQAIYNSSGSFTGEACIAIGPNAIGGSGTKSGSHNIAMGFASLYGNTSGSYNVTIGSASGSGISTGSRNVALGVEAMSSGSMAGDYNVAVGAEAMNTGTKTTACDYNVAIGYQTMDDLTSGATNVAIGYRAGGSIVSTSNNIAIGNDALGPIGLFAGTECIAIGTNSMLSGGKTIACVDNVAIGSDTLTAITSAHTNTAVGSDSGKKVTTGQSNTMLGAQAGGDITTGTYNIAIGYTAMHNQSLTRTMLGDYNIAVGYRSMSQGNKTAACDANVAVGSYSLDEITTGNNNVAVGWNSLSDINYGVENVAVGSNAMYDADDYSSTFNCSYNVAVGYRALADLDSALDIYRRYNTAIGWRAGYNDSSLGTVEELNTFIGANTGPRTGVSANGAVLIGAGAAMTGSSGGGPVVIGAGAGTSGGSNVVIGAAAVSGSTALDSCSGDDSVVIGHEARCTSVVGDSVVIGSGSTTSSNNAIVIGPSITNATSNKIIFGGSSHDLLTCEAAYNSTTISYDYWLVVDPNGKIAQYASSSQRYKEDIRDLEEDTSKIYDLVPRSFKYKDWYCDTKEPVVHGLIAEEVVEVMPELVAMTTYDKLNKKAKENFEGEIPDGEIPDNVRYTKLIVPMLAEMQKLRDRVEELEKQLGE